MTIYSNLLETPTGVSSIITSVMVRPLRIFFAVSFVLIDSLLAHRLRLAIRCGKLGGCAYSTMPVFSMRVKSISLHSYDQCAVVIFRHSVRMREGSESTRKGLQETRITECTIDIRDDRGSGEADMFNVADSSLIDSSS